MASLKARETRRDRTLIAHDATRLWTLGPAWHRRISVGPWRLLRHCLEIIDRAGLVHQRVELEREYGAAGRGRT
jgi:hypothetical protein